MNRRAFLAGMTALAASPAAACPTYRHIAGMELEYAGPRELVLRQGSISIGTSCRIYSSVRDQFISLRGEGTGWHYAWALGNPQTGEITVAVTPAFAVSTAVRAPHIASMRSDGWTDIRLLPVALWWGERLAWRPYFLSGGYPQPDVWWTDAREDAASALVLSGEGLADVSQFVPETGRALYASVNGAGRIGTPGWGWIRLDGETRDVRLLPNSSNQLAYSAPAGAVLRLWARGWNAEQPF